MTGLTLSQKMKNLNGNYPKADNLDNVKKLDDFLREILKEKRKRNEQNIENVLEKLQRKTVDVVGPLSKL